MFSGKFLSAKFLKEISEETHYKLNPKEVNLLDSICASVAVSTCRLLSV